MNDTSQEIGQRIEHSAKLQAASRKAQDKITISNEIARQKLKIIQTVNQVKKGLDHVEDTDEDKTESNAQIYSKIRQYYEYESVHVRKDGTTFPVFITVSIVKDIHGIKPYRIINVHDITERKKLRNMELEVEKTAL